MGAKLKSHVSRLVSTALGQRKLFAIPPMLKDVAESVGAYGCIVWQVAPGVDLDRPEPSGRLVASADWVKNSMKTPRPELPIKSSITGRVVSSSKVINIPNVFKDERVNPAEITGEPGIKAFCSIPITTSDGTRGALNVYRARTFNSDTLAEIVELASLIPTLDEVIRDRASLDLSDKIRLLLVEARSVADERVVPQSEVARVIQEICALLSEAFECVEVSVFLENRIRKRNVYELMGSTCRGNFPKSQITADDSGLTAWVLNQIKPLRIFDLTNFERDQYLIRREYPKLKWTDSRDLKRNLQRVLKVDPFTFPVSFMAAPIARGNSVSGAIRCCAVKNSPYYFSQRDVCLLQLIAEQIGYFWKSWLVSHEAHLESIFWRSVVKSVSDLNLFVYHELKREQPDQRKILGKALRTTSVIPGAEVMDVRLIDESRRELYFAEIYGKAWGEGSEREERMSRRYRLTGSPPSSVGAHVFQTGNPYDIQDVRKDPYYSEMLPQTSHMIVAPIRLGENFYGVLDIGGREEQQFQRHARTVAGFLGQQLAMYSHMSDMIGELRRTRAELDASLRQGAQLQLQQVQTFQDLEHQINTPIMMAHAHAQLTLGSFGSQDEKLRQKLMAIRGLCAKAMRIGRNIELFSSLAKGEAIRLRISAPLRVEELIKLLIEAAEDSRITNSRGNVGFHVSAENINRRHYKYGPFRELLVDRALLEQAIADVLDNAGKYSYSNTRVLISCGRTGTGGLVLAFQNQGIPIHHHEVQKCTERGWKGETARAVSEAGSGIGLWIVAHIMAAHNGQLVIDPTTRDGLTRVRLILPAQRVR